MKNKRLYISLALFCTAIGMSAGSVSADHVDLGGGICELTLMNSIEENASEETIEVSDFAILGYMDDEKTTLAIGTAEGVGYIKKDTLCEIFQDLILPEELPLASETNTFQQGSSSENVAKYQQVLVDLKILDGTADGIFGSKSEAATKEFQKTFHLEETGIADPVTRWMAQDQAADRNVISLVYDTKTYTVEEKFSAICQNTTENLENYLDNKWRFSFDPFEERGIIDPKVVLADVQEGSSDLDRVQITVSLKMVCTIDYMTDQYIVRPALSVDYVGAYRPYIKGAQMSVGAEAAYLTEVETGSQLNGITVEENAYIFLDDTALGFIKSADAKTSVLRIQCQDSTVDVNLDLSDIWCRDQLPDKVSTEYDAYGEEVETFDTTVVE